MLARVTVAVGGLVPGIALAQSGAPGAGVDAGHALQVLAALGAVLLVLVLLAWALRYLLRLTPGGVPGAVRVVAAIPLGTRERVLLLQVGQTQLLVGVAPGRIQTLHVLDRPVDLAGAGDASPGFAPQLARLLGRAREG
jgi:flagellar protein FliO/FliZ